MNRSRFSAVPLTGLVLLAAGSLSAQTTWFVDDGGSAGSGTYFDPFQTIQAGIAAASSGDQVVVQPGTYLENIDFLGKAILVRSAEGPQVTTIDGQSTFGLAAVSFSSGEGPDSVIEGFKITGGFILRPAVHCVGSSPTIQRNVITEKVTASPGGGIRCESSGDVRILFNEISHNVTQPGSGGEGGGIFGTDSTLTIRGNRIVHNLAFSDPFGRGAGIYLTNCSATIADNLIAKNLAVDYGGNSGGGIYLMNCTVTLDNNTIAGNRAPGGKFQPGKGGGLAAFGGDSRVWITNTVFWDNDSDQGSAIHVGGGKVGISFSDVELGLLGTFTAAGSLIWGSGNLDLSPLFVDEASDDYHLLPDSPLVDAGHPLRPAGGTDPDVDPRLLDGDGDAAARMDIGFDELDRTVLSASGTATLGGTLTFTTQAAAPNHEYVLLTSGATGDRAFGAYGSLLLDLFSLTFVSIGVAPDSDGVLLPAQISLAGEELHAQALAVAIGGTPGSFSNRLSFVLH